MASKELTAKDIENRNFIFADIDTLFKRYGHNFRKEAISTGPCTPFEPAGLPKMFTDGHDVLKRAANLFNVNLRVFSFKGMIPPYEELLQESKKFNVKNVKEVEGTGSQPESQGYRFDTEVSTPIAVPTESDKLAKWVDDAKTEKKDSDLWESWRKMGGDKQIYSFLAAWAGYVRAENAFLQKNKKDVELPDDLRQNLQICENTAKHWLFDFYKMPSMAEQDIFLKGFQLSQNLQITADNSSQSAWESFCHIADGRDYAKHAGHADPDFFMVKITYAKSSEIGTAKTRAAALKCYDRFVQAGLADKLQLARSKHGFRSLLDVPSKLCKLSETLGSMMPNSESDKNKFVYFVVDLMEARLVSGGLDNGTSVANLATHVRNLGMVWKVVQGFTTKLSVPPESGEAKLLENMLTPSVFVPSLASREVKERRAMLKPAAKAVVDFLVNALKGQEDAVMEEISINYRKKMDISSILEYPKLNFMKLSTDLSTAYTQENNVRNALTHLHPVSEVDDESGLPPGDDDDEKDSTGSQPEDGIALDPKESKEKMLEEKRREFAEEAIDGQIIFQSLPKTGDAFKDFMKGSMVLRERRGQRMPNTDGPGRHAWVLTAGEESEPNVKDGCKGSPWTWPVLLDEALLRLMANALVSKDNVLAPKRKSKNKQKHQRCFGVARVPWHEIEIKSTEF